MTTTRELKQEQRHVASAMVGALLTAIVVLGITALVDRTAESATFVSRLQFTLRADIIVIAWLVAAIANVARIRFFSERDIAGGSAEAGSNEIRVAGSILQNTFEQAGLAIITHLVVAATLSRSSALITALVCLFALGRLLFWTGYARGAKSRAFGFALTFYPSVLAFLGSATATLFGTTV